MTQAHYFETSTPVEPDKLAEILAIHGIHLREYQAAAPKYAGLIFTPRTIEAVWDRTTGRDICNSGCRNARKQHRAWNEITPEQQREFRQEYIRSINNGIYSHQPEMAMADRPFYDNVALGNCARENTEQSR